MPATIRQFYLYKDGKKVGTCTKKKYDISAGREDVITDDGWAGATQGPVTSKLSCDQIVPVGGTQSGLLEALLAQQYIDVGLGIVDGKIHQLKMVVGTASYDTDASNGTLTGTFEFTGGSPELTG